MCVYIFGTIVTNHIGNDGWLFVTIPIVCCCIVSIMTTFPHFAPSLFGVPSSDLLNYDDVGRACQTRKEEEMGH